MYPETSKKKEYKPVRENELTGDDLDMIRELDYEEKKRNKPYDPYERHWDEA